MFVLETKSTEIKNIYTVQTQIGNTEKTVQEFITRLGVENKQRTSKLIVTIEGGKLVEFTQYIDKKFDEGMYQVERSAA